MIIIEIIHFSDQSWQENKILFDMVIHATFIYYTTNGDEIERDNNMKNA
jgi:hypothetical protein